MSGIVSIKSGDESSLLASVYSTGPISVRVDGRSNAFRVSDEVYAYTMHQQSFTIICHNALFTIPSFIMEGYSILRGVQAQC